MSGPNADEQFDPGAGPAPMSMAGSPASGTAVDPSDFPEVAGYHVSGFIGSGGMSSVWRAMPVSTGRHVALKLMGGVLFGSKAARARFEREVELIARLNHPNIAQIYDSGVSRGVYYYAMELIEGRHLDQYVRDHGLSLRQTLQLLRKLCLALEHAHQRGVIHRDLKPTNIVVSDDGEPHLLDFGLARDAEPEGRGLSVSRAGDVAGTVVYMAPEQAAGQTDRIATATDVYSLGVIGFVLLSGQYPRDVSGSDFDIQRRIIDEQPRRPRQVNPKLDRDLEAMLLKAMAHEPDRRYPSAGLLGEDIRRYLHGDTISARSLTTGYFLRKRLAKYRLQVAIAAVGVAMLLGMAVYAYVQVRAERNNAIRHAQATEHALYLNRIALAQKELADHNIAAARALLERCPPAYRHWEWRHLRALADQSRWSAPHPDGRVRAMRITPDGDRIVAVVQTPGSDSFIRQLNLRDGTEIHRRPLEPFNRAAISNDGLRVAIASGNRLGIASVDAGPPHAGWEAEGDILGLAFCGRDRRIAVVHGDRISLVDLATMQTIGHATARHGKFTQIGCRQRLLTARDGPEARLWRIEPEGLVEAPAPPAPDLEHLAPAAAGQAIVTCTSRGRVALWDAATAEVRSRWLLDQGPQVTSIAATADQVVVGYASGRFELRHAADGRLRRTLSGHGAALEHIVAAGDGGPLVTASRGGTIKTWRPTHAAGSPRVVDLEPATITAVAPWNDGGMLVGQFDRTVVWLDRRGDELHRWQLDSPPLKIAVSPDGSRAVAVCADGRAVAIPCQRTGEAALRGFELEPVTDVIWAFGRFWVAARDRPRLIALPQAGRSLGSGADEPTLHLRRPVAWDASTRTLVGCDGQGRLVTVRRRGGAFERRDHRLPDEFDQPLKIAAAGGMVVVWAGGATRKALLRSGDEQDAPWRPLVLADVQDISLTADGKRLLAVGPQIELWDTRSATQVYAVPTDDAASDAHFAFCHAGEAIIAATDHRLAIWDLAPARSPTERP